jgi:sugar/nucleoside kinase (ribokinase family)
VLNSERPDVTIVGCVQADVIVRPVTDLPLAGSTLLCDDAAVRVGGAGANAGLAAAEAGLAVRLIGCIADDQVGALMREELTAGGIAENLIVVPGDATGLTVALESPLRDRTFITFLGVNSRWEAEMIPDDALNCSSLLLCDYFVAPRLRGEASRQLLGNARAHGARTFFDTSWDPDGFAPATREEVHELLPLVDVMLPNEVEVCALADMPGEPLRAARALQARAGNWIVVKLGADGCLALGPDGAEISVPAPVAEVVDTTGAGDAFNAGLIGGLASGADWPDALSQATHLASEIASRPSRERQNFQLSETQR